MIRSVLSWRVASFWAALLASGTLRAAPIAWETLPGNPGAALTPEQKALVESVLRGQPNYAGCSGSLAACLTAARDHATARRIAAYVARLAARGKTAAELQQAVADRARSAQPAETQTFDLTGRPFRGTPGAPVVVVEFADFHCPFCAKLAVDAHRLVDALGGKVGWYFWHFPVKSHPRAVPAALAAEAVLRQQPATFWAFHDRLYENRLLLEDADLTAHAERVGLPAALVRQALGDATLRNWIATSKMLGIKAQVRETPTLFINGKRYVGLLDPDSLRDRLEEELDLLAGKR